MIILALEDLESGDYEGVREKFILVLNSLGAYEDIKTVFDAIHFSRDGLDKELMFEAYLRYFMAKEENK